MTILWHSYYSASRLEENFSQNIFIGGKSEVVKQSHSKSLFSFPKYVNLITWSSIVAHEVHLQIVVKSVLEIHLTETPPPCLRPTAQQSAELFDHSALSGSLLLAVLPLHPSHPSRISLASRFFTLVLLSVTTSLQQEHCRLRLQGEVLRENPKLKRWKEHSIL